MVCLGIRCPGKKLFLCPHPHTSPNLTSQHASSCRAEVPREEDAGLGPFIVNRGMGQLGRRTKGSEGNQEVGASHSPLQAPGLAGLGGVDRMTSEVSFS